MLSTVIGELKPEWMSRDVTLLLTARATMSIGRALAGVTVPVYVATIGFNGAHIGLLFGLMSIASAAIAAMVGLLADRFNRKLFVVLIPLVTAAAALVVGFTSVILLFYVFAVLGTLGQGSGAGGSSVGPYTPAEQALVTDLTPASHRNSLFGRLAFFAALGALVGSPIAVMSDLAGRIGLHGASAYRPAFLFVAALSEPKQDRPIGTWSLRLAKTIMVVSLALLDRHWRERHRRRILQSLCHLLVSPARPRKALARSDCFTRSSTS